MSPPPPGAHEGDRVHGIGLGILVGALLGLAIGAVTLLAFVLMRRDVVEEIVNNQPLNPPFEAPRPTVLPSNTTNVVNTVNEPAPTPAPTPTEPVNQPASSAAPSVESTSPPDGATDVPKDAEVVITFATDMDPATLTSGSVSVFDAEQGTNIASQLKMSYRADAKQLSITAPEGAYGWGSGNTIDVEVSTIAKDVQGRPLAKAFRMTFSIR